MNTRRAVLNVGDVRGACVIYPSPIHAGETGTELDDGYTRIDF